CQHPPSSHRHLGRRRFSRTHHSHRHHRPDRPPLTTTGNSPSTDTRPHARTSVRLLTLIFEPEPTYESQKPQFPADYRHRAVYSPNLRLPLSAPLGRRLPPAPLARHRPPNAE